jgi:hypothetical protein
MIGEDFEKAIVALECWREMRSDGVNGMLSVAFVLRNRAKAGWFHGSIYDNAIAKNQFSSMTVKGDPNTVRFPDDPVHPDTREPQFQAFLQLIDGVFDDSKLDYITSGALYYAVVSDSTSVWFVTNILSDPINHPRVAQMGQTTFFK